VAGVFLKLGAIGFGGPAAHVALMRRELVTSRQWLDETRFLELFGAANLIPGPSSTELGMLLGYLRAGWAGLVVAGVCFIAPAMALVLTLAWAYVRFGSLPQTGWILSGVKPVIIGIVVDALWQLGRRAIRTWQMAALFGSVIGLYLVGVNLLVLLFGGAAVVMIARNVRTLPRTATIAAPLLPFTATVAPRMRSLSTLLFTFLKIGAAVYGSGYVLLAFLRGDFVQHLHWLTQAQLVDAVAVGQVTPGPVFTTATFIGYVVRGVPGALVATAAIFLPGFVLSGVVYRLLPRVRGSSWASAFLDGVTVCGLGLMAGVTIQLGRAVIVDAFSAGLALVAFLVLRRFQPNSVWLAPGGAALGAVVQGLG
jgi:chromate transporter